MRLYFSIMYRNSHLSLQIEDMNLHIDGKSEYNATFGEYWVLL